MMTGNSARAWDDNPALKDKVDAATKEREAAKASAGDDDGLSQRDRLMLCATIDSDLWHDADFVPFVTVRVGGHLESYPVRSTAYKRILLRTYGQRYPQVIAEGVRTIVVPGAPSTTAIADALAGIEAMAAAGPEKTPFVRVGEHDGQIVIDLGTPDWSAVVIDAKGWQVVERPPVPFIRPAGFRPLPVPSRGSIDLLRPFLNVRDDDDWRLTIAFVIGALKRKGPFPILIVNGEQGSAKSTFCKIIRYLIDPNEAPLRAPPKEERDTLIAAKNGWVLGYDNMSYMDGEQSDWLCRVATGAGFSKRANYTDGEEYIINVCRPVLLNGIPSLTGRPDLADRAIVLVLPEIPESARRPEEEFWRDFDAAAPRILGGLLDGVSRALRDRPTVKLDSLPRMADFSLWSAAAFPAFGWNGGQFVAAYNANRARGVEDTVDADPLAAAVVEIMAERSEFVGTATALLAEVNAKVSVENTRDRAWPKDGARLSNRLRRIAPALRAVGIAVELGLHIGRGADKKRGIRVTRMREDVGTLVDEDVDALEM